VPCGSFTTTQRTTKERLDRAIMFAGPYPSKIVSYMWDSYYTCTAGRDRTLGDEIAADAARPILVDVAREVRDNQSGLVLLGYNLEHGVAVVAAAEPPAAVTEIPVNGSAFDPRFGARNSRFPLHLQRAWVPGAFDNGPLRIRLHTPAGRCFAPFYLSPSRNEPLRD